MRRWYNSLRVACALIPVSMSIAISAYATDRDACLALFGSGNSAQAALSPALAQAKSVIADLEKQVDRLYPTTGFKSRAEFLSAVKNAGPLAVRAREMLAQEDFEVAMAVPDSVRSLIPQSGFLNVHQTNRSLGGKVIGRIPVEAGYIGIDEAEYSKMDSFIKPKSAFLSPKPGSGLTQPITVSAYGQDQYIFKTDRVRDRMSWTPGDSLNRRSAWLSDLPMTEHESWDQFYVPWSRRELAIPFLMSGLADGKLGIHLHTFLESVAYMNNPEEWPSSARRNLIQLTGSSDSNEPVLWTSNSPPEPQLPESLQNYRSAWNFSLDYIEIQLWGPVDLDDVKAFVYTTAPPTGAFLKELQRRGIEIRDGRASSVKKASSDD